MPVPDGRVVIVSDYVGGEGANTGGAGHAIFDSYRALRAAGVDVRVIAAFGALPADAPDCFATLGGTDLREQGQAGALRAIYNPAARRQLEAALAGEDPARTVIILHQWTRYLSPSVMGLLSRFRLMIYMHDYFWSCPNGAYYDFQRGEPCWRRPMGSDCLTANCDRQGRVHKLGRIARQTALLATKRGHAGERLCLHISEQSRRTMAPLLPRDRHAIIRNPDDMAADKPDAAAAPRYDVGYFGRLEPEKGVGLLVDALARSGASGLFVGQGALEPEIAATPNIEHRAWQPRDTMPATMRQCRVVVLPSLWRETWGLIIPEAMAAGVPVLVSARAGSAELVGRFGGGDVFDPAVPGDLDAKLRALLSPPVDDRYALRRWEGFREFLSSRCHAERIVTLAAEMWGVELAPTGASSASSQPAALASARA